jgi:hypothetical protein
MSTPVSSRIRVRPVGRCRARRPARYRFRRYLRVLRTVPCISDGRSSAPTCAHPRPPGPRVVDLAASAVTSFAWLLASPVVCGAIAAFVNPSAGAGGAAAPPPYGARLHRHLFVRRVSRASRQRGCWSARLDVGLFQACIGLGSILRILCDGRLPDRSDAARYLPRLIAVIVCTQLGYVGAQSLSLAVPTASALLATSIRRDADLPDRPVQRCELRRPSRAVHAQAGRRCRAYPTKCRSG